MDKKIQRIRHNKLKGKVLVGLSGGVDSAVSALLLKQQGYEVIAAFMINFSETKNKLTGECSYIEDKKDAQRIASILNIPLKILNFEKPYNKYVIKPMFKSYGEGLTPNPDSLCNKIIKFPLLWKEAKKMKCDFIATGHYIKKTKKRNYYSLNIPKDKHKDQSYFLYTLTQEDLSHTLFPLSDLTKEEVRNIALKNKFPNYNKKSSKGICFVGKINMKSFLKQKLKQKFGKIKDTKGKVVGTHNGMQYYTIGERIREDEGITINKEFRNEVKKKIYIADKNIKKNELIVAPEGSPELKKQNFQIINSQFITPISKNKFPLDCKIRIRHQGDLIPSKIIKLKNKLFCQLRNPIQGIAEGQSAVIYKNSRILGGGEIKNPRLRA
ncbi:MAG: tRNA 2-thiouridine(34) synthase MnmA [Candidatus Pacearchaeota archaeon]|nr:tRNA 2-thiouridine(34) synthase MnmA [Candidatus Pacearchaeota archaeon]